MILQKFVLRQGEYGQLYYRGHGDVRISQDGIYFVIQNKIMGSL